MRTTGVVKWFDRRTGWGEVTLDDGECVVVRRAPVAGDPAPRAPAGHAAALDVAAAIRAGTWGDGGRDY